jgi:hypothetical protein
MMSNPVGMAWLDDQVGVLQVTTNGLTNQRELVPFDVTGGT